MSNQTLTVELVFNGGSIDQAASEQACRTALARRIAELETEQGQIAEATAELFDQYRGSAIPMPTVGSMVAQRLNAQPENHAVLSERVKSYVRANSQETKAADGTVTQHPDSLFVIGKGKNGGVTRRADRPAKA
jgi:hypothetical protein